MVPDTFVSAPLFPRVILTRVVIGDALGNSIPTPGYRAVFPGYLF
jgi:hypothetical protein